MYSDNGMNVKMFRMNVRMFLNLYLTPGYYGWDIKNSIIAVCFTNIMYQYINKFVAHYIINKQKNTKTCSLCCL